MRWATKEPWLTPPEAKAKPREGDKRVIKRFLLWPQRFITGHDDSGFSYETRWLEYAHIVQEYQHNPWPTLFEYGDRRPLHWQSVKWDVEGDKLREAQDTTHIKARDDAKWGISSE